MSRQRGAAEKASSTIVIPREGPSSDHKAATYCKLEIR